MPPANGTVSVTNGTQYNAEVYVECNVGFTILGNASIVCQLSGQWEPESPTCQLIGDELLTKHHSTLNNILLV